MRIREFVATIGEVHSHPLRGASLEPLMTNLGPLLAQLRDYSETHEHKKTIALVNEALRDHRLHIYKSRTDEPDLRVVLRAFYEDRTATDPVSSKGLLDFVLDQLTGEYKRSGTISQPRHAWWALFTVFDRAPNSWLAEHHSQLSRIICRLFAVVEYSPRVDRYTTSFVPELDSAFNEMAWVTINALRILKSPGSVHISAPVLKRLDSFSSKRIEALAVNDDEESLRDIQTRLILLYEASAFLARRDTISLAKRRFLQLGPQTIGRFFYSDEVLTNYRPAREAVRRFIKDRSQWHRATLTSMLISGHPGQGKSELADQISRDIDALAREGGVTCQLDKYVIGTDIRSPSDLDMHLANLRARSDSADVRVVVFDEFDKADFDIYTPFLPFLESPFIDSPVMVFMFAQSSAPTHELFRGHVSTISCSARDFLTRLQLGAIDLPDIRVSPQQRILSLMGMAGDGVRRVSSDVVVWFGLAENIFNNRDLMHEFSRVVEQHDGELTLGPGAELRLAGIEVVLYQGQRWIGVRR